MPRAPHQKEKLFWLLRTLESRSDENHAVPLTELLDELQRHGISAERKSIYDDMETLRNLGYDVALDRKRGYYLASRPFSLVELKLLVDAVQSSRFISEKKSRDLIHRLESLCSRYEAGALQRQVYISDRVKTMNESVFYSIDAIHRAILENRQLSFRYFDYNMYKQKVFRRGGGRYRVSPCALMRSNDAYYLVALEESGERRHYRVDRMDHPEVMEDARSPQTEQLDAAAYTNMHFSMFSGEAQQVRLRCRAGLAHVILDRFSMDLMLVPQGEDAFTVTVNVAVSPQFYGWLLGLGDGVEILSPQSAREGYARLLEQTLRRHQGTPEL